MPITIVCAKCGQTRNVPPSAVRGKTYCSQACAWGSRRTGRHYETKTRLHVIWCKIKSRCLCKTSSGYSYYGGRGIAVCAEWQDSYEAFRDWALANGYRDDLEIDRINNDGNYEPSNCRWASRHQQMRNTRKRSNAKTSKFRGVSWCANVSKWRVQIYRPGIESPYLGLFATEEEAARAYDRAAAESFGEFARLNYPEAIACA
jgi:hypothetical protein